MDLNCRKDIYIVDLLAEKGHVVFIRQLIGILNTSFNVILVGSSSYCEIIGHFPENTIAFNDNLFKQRNKYQFVAKQMVLIQKIKKVLPQNGIALVTGFENISFSIGWRNFNTKGTFAFLHNNLDKKGMSRYFFHQMDKSVTLIVFEEYIKEFLEKTVSNSVACIPHPLNYGILGSEPNKLSDYIFAINVDLVDPSFQDLVTYAEKNHMQLFVKSASKKDDVPKHVHIKRYYKDYIAKLRNASFIAIYAPYNYRVSGVFYECMSINKKIYFLNASTLFPIEMKKQYPQNVEIETPENIKKLSPNGDVFFTKHNDKKILNALLDVISQ